MKSPIVIKHKGNFKKTERFMKKALKHNYMQILHRYGVEGVRLLQEVTPKDSGVTASSWNYKIYDDGKVIHLTWNNTNENNGVSVIILLMYGHGLANGGYVPGNDFVSPAMQPLLQDLANKAWREVTK